MKNKFGTMGIFVGGLALILTLVHFWAGPFTAPPTLESTVAEKAASIRRATIDAIKGKSVESKATSNFNADKITQVITAILAGIAFILAGLSFSRDESIRAAGGAAALGAAAFAFQFIAMYAIAFLVIILIFVVVSGLDA